VPPDPSLELHAWRRSPGTAFFIADQHRLLLLLSLCGEAQVIASLKHPNIVNNLSYGQEKGLHFFAMEYVQGRDLREILKESPLMPFEEALNIIRQVADGLSEAGAKGVVHRDIKPSNIMIDSMGRAYLTDFGVACFEEATEKLTQTGLFLGTPEYSSPEQAKGLTLDVRSDIYSLGAVLYRMLSGRPPVSGQSPLAVVVKISTWEDQTS
jgi:eukaryotic-like serine/threonine-protein kinase